MVPDYNHLLLVPNFTQAVSIQFMFFVVGFVVVLALWISPGGFAWAKTRSMCSVPIPGPSGLPFAGLLRVFTGATPHRALAQLARTFDARPLMAFSIGLTRFVISSDPETAKEILNSSAFADRPVKESAYELLFHRAMGFAPYGEYWRNLRRISATHLFCPTMIASFEPFRYQMGLKMVNQVKELMVKNGKVEIRKVFHFASLSNVMKIVFGRSYHEVDDAGVRGELEELVSEGYELLGIFNWCDHFPFLGWLDPQCVRKRCRALVCKVNAFVGKIIDDHRRRRVRTCPGESTVGDFVDVLLDTEGKGNNKLVESDMIAVLWEMIFRGTDTVAILLEWVLARLVVHPEIQARAQAEIDAVVGSSDSITDSHIARLPYLHAVVKETLRTNPPGPLLSWARLAIQDAHVGDSFVPAGTTAIVNMWAIAHDESVWPRPDKFAPERFLVKDVNIMGCDMRLAPFGSGRRVCPGKTMGLAAVHLWLAQLLRTYLWVPSEIDGPPVDLTECLKLTMEMKNPLVCRALPRVP